MSDFFKKLKYLIIRVPNKLSNTASKHIYIYFNRLLFYFNGIHYGVNMKIYNKIYLTVHPIAEVKIGDNFEFTSGNSINPLCRNIRGCIYAPKGSKIQIGNNVGISSACIWAKESITIGNNVLIGGDSIILDTDAHCLNYNIRKLRTSPITEERLQDGQTAKSVPIEIGNDVLIGTRCIILKGVKIGARSIIGSGSVVTKSIPEDCIAAGNPCKVLKQNINKQNENI